MKDNFNEDVRKIVDDYIKRIESCMGKMPERDKTDFLKEIESHIYESYTESGIKNEIDRILDVLRRIGEPSEVFKTRGSETMKRIGKEKNIPLYILLGAIIAIFGLPIGFGGLGIVIGILGVLLGILVAYFATAFGFTIGGLGGIFASIIHIIDPDFFLRITGEDSFFNLPFVHISNANIEGVVGIFISLLLLSLGIFMMWSGKYIFRGLRSVVIISFNRIKDFFKKKK